MVSRYLYLAKKFSGKMAHNSVIACVQLACVPSIGPGIKLKSEPSDIEVETAVTELP